MTRTGVMVACGTVTIGNGDTPFDRPLNIIDSITDNVNDVGRHTFSSRTYASVKLEGNYGSPENIF